MKRIKTAMHGRRDVVGFDVDFLSQVDAIRTIVGWASDTVGRYVVLANPHSFMEGTRCGAMGSAIRGADLVLADGVGIIIGDMIGNFQNGPRLSGPSLMVDLTRFGVSAGLRHFYFGADLPVLQRLVAVMTDKAPGANVCGYLAPRFGVWSEAEEERYISEIRSARPDVLWVALGSPRQEKWIARNISRLGPTTAIGVGAAFDFHSGRVPWAPKWIRSIGCEWLFRLIVEPRRLWRRNLDSPRFLLLALRFRLVGLVVKTFRSSA